MKLARVIVVISVATALGVQGQEAKEAPKLKVVPRVLSITRPELVRGPNDMVYVDQKGDLIAEGATLPNGQAFTFRIGRRVHVKPEVAASFRQTGETYDYEYQVSNGGGAKQWIQLFWLDVHGAVQNVRVPSYWRMYNVYPRSSAVNRIYIGRLATDADDRARLTPGSSAGPFAVTAAWRPGLVQLSAIGHKSSSPTGGTDEGYETFSGKMSDWLREEINNALADENNSVTAYTIGPKISPNVPAVAAVRGELLKAARLAVFPQQDRKVMLNVASLDSAVEMRNAIRTLNAKASGLAAQFYSAMLSYLP